MVDKGTKNLLFKDKKHINHKSKLVDSLKDIATIIKEAGGVGENREVLVKKLLSNTEMSQEHIPNHHGCAGCDTEKVTEKRICRCMYYYMKVPERCGDKCKLLKKWKNVGNIEIIDYERPARYVVSGVGGMDLIINASGQWYAVEVKPSTNKETLARMFAEILTYTIKMDEKLEATNTKPAICFFEKNGQENSEQMKQYKELIKAGNKDLLYIMEYIKVFCFKVKESPSSNIIEYEICEMDKYEDD